MQPIVHQNVIDTIDAVDDCNAHWKARGLVSGHELAGQASLRTIIITVSVNDRLANIIESLPLKRLCT